MQLILSIAILTIIVTSAVLLLRWGNLKMIGAMPTSMFTFIAILFTSGLDVGLIMFPLTEFPVYKTEAPYGFTNPLAIEFGFWGFLIWIFYFLTTFYFCVIEPKVKLFEIKFIKILNNVVVIGTCAFTGYLFLNYLPNYITGITEVPKYILVGIVVLCAVLSSTDVKYVKILSVASTWVFFALIAIMWFASGMGITGMASTLANIGEYFTNIHRFVTPLTDYHAFYLFWWFSWSIMIGQFVSRFVGPVNTLQLVLALLIFPSIPIAIWFAVLYYYFTNGIVISGLFNAGMVIVGIIFVINSLDSLTRLYSENLKLTVNTLGKRNYILLHFFILSGLILMFKFTPLQIEWIGLVVIFLYLVIYALLFHKRKQLMSNSRQEISYS